MENQLAQIVNESGLEKTKAQVLLENFSNYFEIAAEWEAKLKAIQVTDITQVAEMKMCREARLFLKDKRVDIEKTRKMLKESALREGQTIDSIAKILTNLIVPLEKDAEEKEKFAERREAEAKQVRLEERNKLITPYSEFIPFGLDFLNMLDHDFEKILTGAKSQHEAKIEAERKAEADRIAKEKAEEEKRERIRLENERLKKEAEEREKVLAEERKKAEAEKKALEEKARKEREAAELARKKAEAEQAAKLEAERKEREKVESELKAKKDAEEAARKQAEQEEKQRKAAERKAALAPDKDKLNNWVNNCTLPDISLSSENSKAVENVIRAKFDAFKNWAKTQIETIN